MKRQVRFGRRAGVNLMNFLLLAMVAIFSSKCFRNLFPYILSRFPNDVLSCVADSADKDELLCRLVCRQIAFDRPMQSLKLGSLASLRNAIPLLQRKNAFCAECFCTLASYPALKLLASSTRISGQ
jgi:hypothetical protein